MQLLQTSRRMPALETSYRCRLLETSRQMLSFRDVLSDAFFRERLDGCRL